MAFQQLDSSKGVAGKIGYAGILELTCRFPYTAFIVGKDGESVIYLPADLQVVAILRAAARNNHNHRIRAVRLWERQRTS